MALYAIGDVQGCADELDALLSKIGLGADDRVWFVGDIVNRGPASLRALRTVIALGRQATVVLGNHDLHLIACAHGLRRSRKATFSDVLAAPDRHDLIDWLCERPLVHLEDDLLLVHAGLAPGWTAREAVRRARLVESFLSFDGGLSLLRHYAAGAPPPHDPRLARAAETLFWTTRVRCLDEQGRPDDDYSGPPGDAPEGLTPWFAVPGRASRDVQIVFGHWAALGLHRDDNVLGLDTGCVWGRELTAVRLDDGAVFSVAATGSN